MAKKPAPLLPIPVPPIEEGLQAQMVALVLAETAIVANPKHHEGAAFKQSINIAPNMMRAPSDPLRRQLRIRLDLKSDDKADLAPYLGHISGVCEIVFSTAPSSPETGDRIAAWSHVGILLGFLRTNLQQITAVGPYPRVLLGAASTADVLRNATVFASPGSPGFQMYPEEFLKAAEAEKAVKP